MKMSPIPTLLSFFLRRISVGFQRSINRLHSSILCGVRLDQVILIILWTILLFVTSVNNFFHEHFFLPVATGYIVEKTVQIYSPSSKYYFVDFALLFGITSLVSLELVRLSHCNISSGKLTKWWSVSSLVSLRTTMTNSIRIILFYYILWHYHYYYYYLLQHW